MIHVEPIVQTLRVFRGGRLYGAPYDAVATLTLCGDLACMPGMHGDFSRADWQDMQRVLAGRSVRDLLIIRNGERVWYDVATGERGRGRFPVYPGA